MERVRAAAVAVASAALLWLMLDSGAFGPPSPRVLSVSLGTLALIFAVGAWAMAVGGRRERTPLLAGLAIGVGGYAVLRLFAF
jgi:peptidoglycan/LPS O-acetylase OafA/YrhL